MIALAYSLGIVAVSAYLLFASLGGGIVAGPIGLIRGEDGRLSTSKFQFFFWTGVTVFSYVALYVAWRANCDKQCGNLPDLPSNVLLAMGFSVITATSAKAITSTYVTSGRIVKTFSKAFSVSDLVINDERTAPDLSKVQMLIWTAVAGGTYLYTVGSALPSFGVTVPTSFPDIDKALMALMGIGQGAYLGAKIVVSPSVMLANVTPPREKAGGNVTLNGAGLGAIAGTVKFGDVVANPQAIAGAWTDGAIKVIVPVGPAAGATVDVGVFIPGVQGTASTGNTVPFTYA